MRVTRGDAIQPYLPPDSVKNMKNCERGHCPGPEAKEISMISMKRKLKWLAIVLAVLLLGFGTALLLWPRDRITAESWKQIQIGMSEKEVEDILGKRGLKYEEFKAKYKWI